MLGHSPLQFRDHHRTIRSNCGSTLRYRRYT